MILKVNYQINVGEITISPSLCSTLVPKAVIPTDGEGHIDPTAVLTSDGAPGELRAGFTRTTVNYG